MKRILVLGSLNIDLVQRIPRIPVPGETLTGSDLRIFVGGKGVNQACAAARLGGQVEMAGKVGNDVFAERLRRELQNAGVDTKLVRDSKGASGSAIIFVLPNGDNMIVISPGANANISVEFALEAVQNLQAGDLLLCQLEIPLEAVEAAIEAARRKMIVTVLDPAPARDLPAGLLKSVSILTPNQTEASFLLGRTQGLESIAEAQSAGRELCARGSETVIVKMGAQGCVIAKGEKATAVSGFSADVVDTTAAGDTFNGALTVALEEGRTMIEAARFANAAAALSVTKPGAITSIPNRSEVERFLALQSSAV